MNKRLIGAAVCAGIVLTACGSGTEMASSSAPSAAAAPASTVTVTATTTQQSKVVTTTILERTETERVTETVAAGSSEDEVLCGVAAVLFKHMDGVESRGDNPLSFVVSEAQQVQDSLDGVSYFFEGGGAYGLDLAYQWQQFELQTIRFTTGGSVEDYAAARRQVTDGCAGLNG